MNRFILAIISLLISFNAILAQPSSVKKMANSVFKLTAYDAEGNVSASTYGVFTSNDGIAVGVWSTLANASKAVVTDFNGKQYTVLSIIGADELYDVCKFRVDVAKSYPAVLAGTPSQGGAKVWLVNTEDKKVSAYEYTVEKTEPFMEKYGYYIFAYKDRNEVSGSPFINSNGQVVGLALPSETSLAPHAVDASYANSLKFMPLSVNDNKFSKTGIRLELPNDKKEALLMVMLAGEKHDSLKYSGYISDYIKKFPHEVDGYSTSALNKINRNDFAGADADMNTAIKLADNKAEAHYEYAHVIYNKLLYSSDSLFSSWTFDKALAEAEKAYELDAQPSYKHRIAQITYSKGDYKKAYDMFIGLSETPIRNSEIFFEAAQCKNQLEADKSEIIALLDSAITLCSTPYTSISAPYFLARGQVYDSMGNYRKALADYNVYDTIFYGRADADFYYTRYKCELELKQYQQALNDIAHAAMVSQNKTYYLSEMASLQLRVNRFEDAVRTADICLQLMPENTDVLLIKGLALILSDKKKEGLDYLQKADELGDDRAKSYIKKYK